ncbi:MAG: citrate lyase holo-[Clostridia bacterium]|nr:citrate lyase holo-[acyl-carrier protein] synthase [Clostridia bacterium]
MPEVTLEQVLFARETRARRQQELLSAFGMPLVCFTLNIAGPVKVDAYSRYAFAEGRARLIEGLKTMGWPVLHSEDISCEAGFGLMAVVNAKAEAVKRLCVQLEERDSLGRLFDMDVLAPDGSKLERGSERKCLVCGQPGRGCASRRVHPVSELQAVTRRVILEHKRLADSERIASLAVQSLLDEVCAAPKPGLVDRLDHGSHRDMDIFTFNASAAALWPNFQK